MGTKTTNIKIGTLLQRWQDDEGRMHKFYIPDSYFVPNCNVRLLSLQHWAKTMKDNKPVEGTGCTTTSKSVQLQWNQKKYRLDVPLSKTTNVATFRSAPGFNRYLNFCTEEAITFENEDNHPSISAMSSIEDEEEQVRMANIVECKDTYKVRL